MNRKVTVVGGAGNVGATVARSIAMKELADVVVVDIADSKAAGVALDIYQSCPIEGSASRVMGVGTKDFAETANSDVVVITSDNPRTEDPERIMDDIAVALPAGRFERIEDRRAAIARAIAMADRERDLVLLAGKGHEDYQVRGTQKLHFDEREIVAELLGATPAGEA